MAYSNVASVAGMFPTFVRGTAQQKPPDSLIQQFIDDIASVITSILLRRFGEAMAASPYNGSLSLWLASLGLPNARWNADQPFATGTVVVDGNLPPAAQQATSGGTAGSAPPNFSAIYGETVTDGTITWTNIGQTPQFEVLERGNRYGAASQLGTTLASFGVRGVQDLTKEYRESDWQPFLDDLNAARRIKRGASAEPVGMGPFDVLFDPLAIVSSPRPGLLGIAGGDQDPHQTPYTEGLAAYFGKFSRDYGEFPGGWPDPE